MIPIRSDRFVSMVLKFNPSHDVKTGKFVSARSVGSSEVITDHRFRPEKPVGTSQYWYDCVAPKFNQRVKMYADLQPTIGEPKVTVGEYLDKVQAHVDKLVANCDVYVRRRQETLALILADGRFKTQHDAKRSGGYFNPSRRQSFETVVLDVDPKSPKTTRPVYGYLSDRADGKINNSHASLVQYGDVVIRLKKSVRERTTFTIRDSYDDAGYYPQQRRKYDVTKADFLPSPVNRPSIYSMRVGVNMHREPATVDATRYLEAQIRGGVKATDIDRVVFSKAPERSMMNSLKEHNIAWDVVEA